MTRAVPGWLSGPIVGAALFMSSRQDTVYKAYAQVLINQTTPASAVLGMNARSARTTARTLVMIDPLK